MVRLPERNRARKADVEKLKGAAEQEARETFAVNRRFVLRSFE
jgi:hypothetical protein